MLTKPVVQLEPNAPVQGDVIVPILPSVWDAPPAVAITSHAPGAVVLSGASVQLVAQGLDAEDGPLAASGCEWSVAGVGVIGTGSPLNVVAGSSLLPLGAGGAAAVRAITARFVDSRGQAGTSTVSIEVRPNTNPAPAVNFLDPAAGTALVRGQTYPVRATITTQQGTITDAELLLNGAPVQALTVSSSVPNQYEGSIVVAADAPLVTRNYAIRATNSGGATTTSPARALTVVAGGSVPTGIVAAYIAEIDARRDNAERPLLSNTVKNRISEMWERIGNRDSEDGLTTNRQDNIADIFLLSADYNVGSGTEVVGLKGTILAMGGTTLPTWGATGMLFPGAGAARLTKVDGIAVGATSIGLLALVAASDVTAGNQRYIAAVDEAVSGGWWFSRNASNGVRMGARATTGGTFHKDSTALPFGTTARQLVGGTYSSTGDQVRTIVNGVAEVTTDSRFNSVVPAEAFTVGGSKSGAALWLGEICFLVVFNLNFTTTDQVAIGEILMDTVGLGL